MLKLLVICEISLGSKNSTGIFYLYTKFGGDPHIVAAGDRTVRSFLLLVCLFVCLSHLT